ncbi:MAG: leucine-rich repeat domain-containing protein [Coprobacillus sp.]|nr:leucine-rich repeat domain-containing protein [Coprobacillus sp.]
MAKRNTFNGMKIIPRYGGAQFFAGLFCLIIAAILILPLFTPVFSITFYYADALEGEGTVIANTGWDFLMSLFQQAQSPLSDVYSYVSWDMQLIEASTALVWIEYIFAVFLIVGLIYAFFLILYALGLIFLGQIKRYTAPRTLSILVCVLVVVNFLILFLIQYLATGYMHISYEEVHQVDFSISFYSYVYLAVAVLSMIIMIIIVNSSFLGRVRMKDLPYTKDYIKSHMQEHYFVPGLEDNKSSAPQTIVTPAPNITIQNIPAPLPLTSENKEVTNKELPPTTTSLGGHDFAANTNIENANIPEDITSIGVGCFANCLNLKSVTLPKDLKSIGANAFFNCVSLKKILYPGTKEDFRKVTRGSNWLYKAGTNVIICKDGAVEVNPYR